MKYAAFISYRHTAESRRQAVALEAALKQYAKPLWKPPLAIFRDERVLRPGDDLPSVLREALVGSRFLLYLASKEAAQSEWIEQELQIWCHELDRAKALIIVHVADRISVDTATGRVVWEHSDALPRVLEPYIRSIPVWSDLSWAKTSEHRDLSHLDYRKEINAIVAAFRDVTPGDMNDEQVLVHRRNLRLRNGGIAAVIAFALLALGFGLQARADRNAARASAQAAALSERRALLSAGEAVEQSTIAKEQRDLATQREGEANRQRDLATKREREANEQRLLAERQTGIALSRQLSAQARGALDRYPIRALLLAIESVAAMRRFGVIPPMAQEALRAAISPPRGGIGVAGHAGPVSVLAISGDSRWMVTGGEDGTIRMWSLDRGKEGAPGLSFRCGAPRGYVGRVTLVAADQRASRIAATTLDGHACLWRVDAAAGTESPVPAPLAFPGGVRALAFDRDGEMLLTGGGDRVVRVWDLTKDARTPPKTLVGHDGSVTQASFKDDRRWALTADDDDTARLWNLSASAGTAAASTVLPLADAATRNRGGTPDPVDVLGVRFVGDKWVAVVDERFVRLWDAGRLPALAKPILFNGHQDVIRAAAFSPDGSLLATGAWDRRIVVMDLRTTDPSQKPRVLELPDLVGSLAFDPTGRWLTAGARNGRVYMWDLVSAMTDATVLHGHDDWVNMVAVSPDGRWAASVGNDAMARLWPMEAPLRSAEPVVFSLSGFDQVQSLAVNGPWLVTGTLNEGPVFRRIDTPRDRKGAPLRLGSAGINSLALSRDRRWLAAGTGTAGIALWEHPLVRPEKSPRILLPNAWTAAHQKLAISRNSRWLAAINQASDAVRVWDLTAKSADQPLVLKVAAEAVMDVALSDDGCWVVGGGSDGVAVVWNLCGSDKGSVAARLRGQGGGFNAVAVSPDNRWVVTGGQDGHARLWTHTGKAFGTTPILLPGHVQSVARILISPDSRWLLTVSSRETAMLWDLKKLRAEASPVPLLGHVGAITDAAFSPNGKLLATGGDDGAVRLWQLDIDETAAHPIVLQAHKSQVAQIAFTDDNLALVTGGWDAAVRIWNLRVEDVMSLGCRVAGRSLTPAELTQFLPIPGYPLFCAGDRSHRLPVADHDSFPAAAVRSP